MRFLSNLIFCLASLGACFALTGCPDKDGPAERAGEKIDNAAEKVGEGAESAADKVEGAVEEAGDKIEEATE
jgi:hyperosmotically inducible protein